MGEAAKSVILVVEDEEVLRLHAADLLEEHGFSVIEAESADVAQEILETRDDVRLLFTDVQMPGASDGMDLARQVHSRWPNILLVITSGKERPTRAEIPDDGRFVSKPYRADELLGEVNDLMAKPSPRPSSSSHLWAGAGLLRASDPTPRSHQKDGCALKTGCALLQRPHRPRGRQFLDGFNMALSDKIAPHI